jgi:hypothetical protein
MRKIKAKTGSISRKFNPKSNYLGEISWVSGRLHAPAHPCAGFFS